MKTGFAGVVIEQTATAVRLGDGGSDADFVYDATKVSEAPSLSDIMGKIKPR